MFTDLVGSTALRVRVGEDAATGFLRWATGEAHGDGTYRFETLITPTTGATTTLLATVKVSNVHR